MSVNKMLVNKMSVNLYNVARACGSSFGALIIETDALVCVPVFQGRRGQVR